MSTEKELKIVDLNLISGSSETTRIAFGSYYEIISGTYGEILEVVKWRQTPHFEYEASLYDGGSFYSIGNWYTAGTDDYKDVSQQETISDKVITLNKRFPTRVWAVEDNVKNDNYWKTLWMGGSWGTSSYKAIWTDAVFDDHSFEYTLPYSQQEVNNIYGSEAFTDVSQITYTYNRYLREYQDYVEDLDSELLIPNMYLLKEYEQYLVDAETGASYVAADETTEATAETTIILSSSIINFVTRENNALTEWDATYFDFPSNAFESSDVALSWDSLLLENDFASQYLTSSLLLYPLSASTEIEAKNVLQNIMFDHGALNPSNNSPYNTISDSLPNSQVDFDAGGTYGSDEDTHGLTYASKIPYYTTINFDTERNSDTTFSDLILANSFSQKFLKTLKEAFLEEAEDLVPDETTYAVESSYYSASADSASVTYYDITSTDNTTYRNIDFMKMLSYAHSNYISTTDNCYYIGGRIYNRNSVFDKTGIYRHSNAINSLAMIEAVTAWIDNIDNFDIINIWRLYNNTTWDSTSTGNAMYTKYYETLAYRVEKVGGAATGDSRTQNVLQNFWFFNRSDISEIFLRDSQVKYGKAYTYNVYAYVLTIGVKYNFSDLRLTRHIGTYDDDEPCLEYYDPKTGATVEAIYHDWEDNPLYSTLENNYASNAQFIPTKIGDTVDDFLAEFYVNYEPSLKLVEVPIFSKTLKVLDNPPNNFDINPYQVNDNSQTIGFGINYETFYIVADDIAGMTYPTSISAADKTIKSDYLYARDILSGSYLEVESVSRQRYFEAYRLDKKPSSIGDFDGNRISTIDLRIPSTKYTYSNTDFRDKIKTNQKYYYLFRFVNEQGVPGQLSDIYEAELVDDGGYKYAVFNILFESELGEEVFVNPLKSFKKVIQLQPNISQLLLDSSEADFDNSAIDEIANVSVGSAEDLIWDQTFKLRLTSKKTGKKIDFNITYKTENQYDSTE